MTGSQILVSCVASMRSTDICKFWCPAFWPTVLILKCFINIVELTNVVQRIYFIARVPSSFPQLWRKETLTLACVGGCWLDSRSFSCWLLCPSPYGCASRSAAYQFRADKYFWIKWMHPTQISQCLEMVDLMLPVCTFTTVFLFTKCLEVYLFIYCL